MGSLVGTWIGSLTRTFMGKGEHEEEDEAEVMGRKKGWGNRNREKGYKKGIIIFFYLLCNTWY